MACCTFSMLEIRPLTPNKCKIQSTDTLNILGHNCNQQQEFVKQRTVALHHCVFFKLKFPKHLLILLFWVNFINATVVTPLGQHWMKCLCVHSSSVIHLFDHKKNGSLHLSGFSQKFLNYGLLYFQ